MINNKKITSFLKRFLIHNQTSLDLIQLNWYKTIFAYWSNQNKSVLVLFWKNWHDKKFLWNDTMCSCLSQQLVITYESYLNFCPDIQSSSSLFTEHLSAVSQLVLTYAICQPMRMSCYCRPAWVCERVWMQYCIVHVCYEILLNMEWFSFLSWFYAVIFSSAYAYAYFFAALFLHLTAKLWENRWSTTKRIIFN